MEMDSKTKISQQDRISYLERMVSSTKLQFNAEHKRCQELLHRMSINTQDQLSLEKNLTELQCKYESMKKEFDKMAKEHCMLSEKNYDLEIALAEGDVYDQIVKENMEKLENLCTTLREQRDEQNTYHKQKEVSLRNDFEIKLTKLKEEKAEVLKNLTDSKLENVSLKDELDHFRESEDDWKKEKERMEKDMQSLSSRVRILEKDLNMEKETVTMLQLKNNDLSASLMEVDKSRPTSGPISKESISMIEELVNKFYEKKLEAASSFNDHVIEDLKTQLAECQNVLADEKQARRNLESQLKDTEAELTHAKTNADSLFELSVARTRNNLNRCNNLKTSPPRQLNDLTLTHFNPLLSLSKPVFFDSINSTAYAANKTPISTSREHSDNDENVATTADSILTNVSTNNSLLED